MKRTLQKIILLLNRTLFFGVLVVSVSSIYYTVLPADDLWAAAVNDIDEAPGYEDPKDVKREWAVSLGIGSIFSPDYEGSNNYKLSYGPNISASWRDLVFFKGKTLGANLVRYKKFKAGPIASWSSGRDEDDNEKLEGLGDIDDSVEAGGFVAYRNKPLRFRLEARQDIGSGHEGALVELSAGTTMPFEDPIVSLELGATWASSDYMERFFGIDSQQAVASGLEKYHARAGIKGINLRMAGGHAISKRWRIGATLGYKRLVGDAAGSPIVDDKNQYLAGFELSYHMGSKILPEDLQ